MGIPVQLEDPKAYFDAEEVLVMLQILQVIDNARQDIPYAAFLRAGLKTGAKGQDQAGPCERVCISDTELTKLSMYRSHRGEMLYDTAERWIRDQSDTELGRKLKGLHAMLALWKKEAAYLSIAQLIDRVLSDTDYRLTAASLPGGDRRLSNLMRLIRKAEDFEQAGNHGLFSFLQYIGKCRIHEADFGAAGGFTEVSNSVRICTVHSSKGLEYPVVFLSRLGRSYNKEDMKKPVGISSRYGIAPNHVRRVGERYVVSTKGIYRDAVNRLEYLASVHEELRLLYVGMTRAKELLIMTGACKDAEDQCGGEEGKGTVSYSELAEASSNLDYILTVLRAEGRNADRYLKRRIWKAQDLPGIVREEIPIPPQSDRTEEAGLALAEKLKEAYHFNYPYAAAVETRSKLSVSEIKHEAMQTLLGDEIYGRGDAGETASGENAISETEKTEGDKEKLHQVRATDYGTAVHKLMELLPFEEIGSRKEMADRIRELLLKPHFTPELRKVIRPERLADFFSKEEGSLFARMKKAAAGGKLYREQQFLIGLPADRLLQEIPLVDEDGEPEEEQRRTSTEQVVLQGVIDAFFLETDEEGQEYAVLMDYKTDRVDSGEELIRRYRAQLSLYRETLERIMGVPVSEVYLYGFGKGLGEVKVDSYSAVEG